MGTNYNLEQPAVSSSPVATPVNASAPEEKSKSSYGLLIIAIVFLLAVVGILLYLLYISTAKTTDADVTPTSSVVLAPTATPDPRYDGWQTYSKTTSIQSYSFRYPADWTLSEEATSETDIEVAVTSPESADYSFHLTFINGPADSTACIFPDTDPAEAEQIKKYPLIGYYMIEEFVDIEREGVLFARRGFHTNVSENLPEPIYFTCLVDPTTKSGYVATPYRYSIPDVKTEELEEEIMQTLDLILLSFTENRVR